MRCKICGKCFRHIVKDSKSKETQICNYCRKGIIYQKSGRYNNKNAKGLSII